MAQAENSVWPTKYMLSKTLTGSACQVSRAGAAGGPPALAPRPGPPARGGAEASAITLRAVVHTASKRPACSVPAAAFAAAMCVSTSGESGAGAGA